MTERIIVEDLKLWRDEKMILHGIDWQVNAGEHWAILGANGSGKTSLIMSIAGYLSYSSGRIFLLEGWHGKVHLPNMRRKIGIVSSSLVERHVKNVPRITPHQIVLSGLFGSVGLFDPVSIAQEEDALTHLKAVGIEHLAYETFTTLSTGERQAAMLARTRMANNSLVVLDESCAGLDLAARERFLHSVQAIIAERPETTVVMITHHPEEIVPGITHVLLLRDGRIVAAGPRDSVMTNPNLSETFGVEVAVSAENGRYWVKVV